MLITPSNSGKSYINRKKFAAVSLQAVCTADRYIIDASTGWPSSMNDKRIFRRSSLSKYLPRCLRGTPYHLIGDGGYKLSTSLMIPYREDRPLTDVTFTQ